MTFELAKQVFDKLESSQIIELKFDLYRATEKYTGYRTNRRQSRPEDRHLIDPGRTRSHNALIDAFKILNREQLKHGEDNSWRAQLGEDRKELGDMAAYIVLFLALSAR